ncbi:hypothetical protein [Terasakiella pusilla]|uniref:hypothetical protein n=1 Tax=Terasakiella pusilla TaxID=64973 RepID=UPI003AA87A2E
MIQLQTYEISLPTYFSCLTNYLQTNNKADLHKIVENFAKIAEQQDIQVMKGETPLDLGNAHLFDHTLFRQLAEYHSDLLDAGLLKVEENVPKLVKQTHFLNPNQNLMSFLQVPEYSLSKAGKIMVYLQAKCPTLFGNGFLKTWVKLISGIKSYRWAIAFGGVLSTGYKAFSSAGIIIDHFAIWLILFILTSILGGFIYLTKN